MEVLLGLLFVILLIVGFVWMLISPFFFASLRSRIEDLEKEIAHLKLMERKQGNLQRTSQVRSTPEHPGETIGPPIDPGITLKPRPGFSNRRGDFKSELDASIRHEPRLDGELVQESAGEAIYVPPEIEAEASTAAPFSQVGRPVATVSPEIDVEAPTVASLPVLEVDANSGVLLTRSDEPAEKSVDSLVGNPPPIADVHQNPPRHDRDEPTTLEELLGGKWLSWIGALAIIIGAGFGFKYAVENNWIGPRERVLIGIVAGLGCFAGGAYAIRRNYLFLAQSLAGAGLGILYLSLYAAFGWYGILSYEASFIGMILTTTLGLTFAGYFNIQPTAVLGMLGGFLTPVMLWPRQDPMWTLFPYLMMLDVGILLIAGVRRWAGLEILAFCGTVIIWLGWHREFYQEEQLGATAGFMTAFLVLFALLSVWHNVIRKRTAMAGDFFLILVTPITYFAALYSLTFERLPHWQGEFSLGVMLFYALLACLAAIWHPAGTSVIAALAGVASTFLILAAPLELTGHWVTICWIAQAVLLVELGLYFRERSLAWTGLGLLAKVQGILLIYFLGTLADPVHFQTAFVRIQLHLIGRPETPIDSADSWWALINGRSLSYLADVIGFSFLAWEFSRRRKDSALMESLVPPYRQCQIWLNVTIPIVALSMIILETYVWGVIWHWDQATIASAWTIWTAGFACGLILWSRVFWSRGIEAVGWLLFALLAGLVVFNSLEALNVATLGAGIPEHRLHALWLINPRGISISTVIFASIFAALIYAAFPDRDVEATRSQERLTPQQLTRILGVAAYVMAWGLFLLETRVWGAHHGWLPSTTLSACAIWTTLFLLGAVLWRVTRRMPWLDSLVQTAFFVLNFLLLLNTLVSIGAFHPSMSNSTDGYSNWWLLNPRGIGYLVSLIGCAVAAILYRDPKLDEVAKPNGGWTLPQLLGVGAYLIGLVSVILETCAWGYPHGWLIGTLLGASSIWISVFAVGLAAWSARFRRADVDGLLGLIYLALCITLMSMYVGTLASLENQPGIAGRAFRVAIEPWCWNPRFATFLAAIVAAAMSSWLYRGIKVTNNATGAVEQSQDVSSIFATAVYIAGVVMFSLEMYTQGTSRAWLTATSLGITLVWTIYATLTLIVGIYVRSGWVRVFSLGLFVLTVIKVFMFDVWQLETVIRVVAFISLGVALLLVSFLYRRFRDRIRSWMAPELSG
jgi:hypothetical protein